MTQPDSDAVRASRDRAKTRIIAPVARELRIAGLLSVLAGLIWPVQAAVLAWAVSAWAGGRRPWMWQRAPPLCSFSARCCAPCWSIAPARFCSTLRIA